ncbi:MAG TPA: squalene/phytoene synthase family protein [Steroidobacteraceae bacterium]|nr:squalene/phytoene synthase family protein [Steroidobacteraceae bacterium]
MTAARPARPATRLLASLYATDSQRTLLGALCALEEEIGASLAAGIDHDVAHTRLAWWREECARCAAGTPSAPVTRAIAAHFAGRERTALAGLAGLVEGAAWDLAAATFATRAELARYCERWSAGLIVPLAQFAAPQLDVAAVRTLGAALREIELLGSLAQDARRGRVRLPLDELAAARVDPAGLLAPPWPAPLAAHLARRHRELRAGLAGAVRALPQAAQQPLRALLVWARLAVLESQRIERCLPAAPSPGDHRGALDGWRAWRAARRADSGNLAL